VKDDLVFFTAGTHCFFLQKFEFKLVLLLIMPFWQTFTFFMQIESHIYNTPLPCLNVLNKFSTLILTLVLFYSVLAHKKGAVITAPFFNHALGFLL
jgi:hypothetical protein